MSECTASVAIAAQAVMSRASLAPSATVVVLFEWVFSKAKLDRAQHARWPLPAVDPEAAVAQAT